MKNPDIYTKADGGVSKQEIKIELSPNQIIMIEDKSYKITLNYDSVTKYTGRFLYKKNNILTIGISAESEQGFEYKENDVVSILIVENKSLYNFDANILAIREAELPDEFEIGDMADEFNNSEKYNKYVVDIVPLTAPQKQQRREFYRMPLGINIYYKIIEADEADKIEAYNLKFEPEKAKKIKKSADEGLLEKENGYLKLTTIELSAGGFKYQSMTNIEAGIFLDCVLIVNDEALPAIAQILSSSPDRQYPDLYNMRVLFNKISDPVRAKIVKYIFAQQRQVHSKFLPEET